MIAKSQQPKGQDSALSSLNTVIDALNLAKEVSSITPAKAAFDSASDLLTRVKVSFLRFVLVGFWLIYIGLNDQQGGLRTSG